jgi:hypothetical protein
VTITANPFAPSTTRPATSPSSVLDGSADDDVQYLLDMDDREFRTFVLEHLGRNEPDRVWRALTDPEVVLDTTEVLREKCAEVTEAARVPGIDRELRGRRERFLRLVQFRLGQVREARRVRHQQLALERRDEFEVLARTLALAVNAHRLACVAADLAPEPHDVALWDLLDDLRLPGDGDHAESLTLAEAVLRGIWREAPDGEVDRV